MLAQHILGKAGLYRQRLQVGFQLHRLAHLGKNLRAALGVFDALVVVAQIQILFGALHAVFRRLERPQMLESIQTALTDELIRIQIIGEEQHAGADIFLLKNFQRAHDGVLSCAVAIIGYPYFGRIAL